MPIEYKHGPEKEYVALKKHSVVWDVGAQRQVQVHGRDACAAVQRMSSRDVRRMKVGTCKYALFCDFNGDVVNDPIIMRMDKDRYWLSSADADLRAWASALCADKQVTIRELDIAPIAVQGPSSNGVLVRSGFDPSVVDALKRFNFVNTTCRGHPVTIARTGWSPEDGFELYPTRGETSSQEIWDALLAENPDVCVGVPNQSRRIEHGMLSVGCDTFKGLNAMELGSLARFVDLDVDGIDFVGRESLRKYMRDTQNSPRRRLCGVEFSRDPLRLGFGNEYDVSRRRDIIFNDDEVVGKVTCCAWSPAVGAQIGMAIVASDLDAGTPVKVDLPEGFVDATLRELPFV